MTLLADFYRDISCGLRMLRNAPGFTLVAVLTLAIAIAAGTTVFSVVNSVLLRPLPYEQPEQLTLIWGTNHSAGQARDVVSGPNFLDLRERGGSFRNMAAFHSSEMTIQRGSGADVVPRLRVTPEFFSVLGVAPHMGRMLLSEDGHNGDSSVALIGYEFWQRELGADPSVVGRTLTELGQPHTIVGVLPPRFTFFVSPDIVTPLQYDALREQSRTHHHYWIVARLQNDVAAGAAGAELDAIADSIVAEFPAMTGWEFTVDPLQTAMVESVRPALWMLLAAVALLFLIACANVANLIVMRDLGRRQELAVRTALGAGRGRLIRQLLAEGACLAAVSGAAGGALAVWLVPLVNLLLPPAVPIPGSAASINLATVRLDGWTLGFAVLLSAVAVLLFGLLSAWKTSSHQPADSLRSATARTTGSREQRRVRSVLMAVEVALATVLVTGMGLMVRTVVELMQVDPGFDGRGVIAMKVGRQHDRNPQERAVHYRQVVDRVSALPGVTAAGLNDYILLTNEDDFEGFHLEAHPLPQPGQYPREEWRRVSPGYFEAMQIPLEKGRLFTTADNEQTESVVLINRAAARKYWPEGDPIGQRIVLHHDAYDSSRVVGIVGDVRYARLDKPARPMLYVPYQRAPRPEMGLFVRAAGGLDDAIVPAIHAAIRSVDRTQPISAVARVETVVSSAISIQRLTLWISMALAVISVLLAAVGVFGVNAYAVGQRTREFGIRMAMGARRPDIIRLVLFQGLPVISIGAVVGVVLAAALSRTLDSLLYGVTPYDPSAYLSAAAILIAAGLLACIVPARRALRIEPASALRSD